MMAALRRPSDIFLRGKVNVFQCIVKYGNTKMYLSSRPNYERKPTSKHSPVARQISRAWNVHPLVLQTLRRDILINPRFKGQTVTPTIDLKMNHEKRKLSIGETLSITDNTLLKIRLQNFCKMSRSHIAENARLLEMECCSQLYRWTVPQMLFAMDVFFVVQHNAPMLYNGIFEKLDIQLVPEGKLEPKDIVQTLFYASSYRRCPTSLMRNLEKLIHEQIGSYTANELGLICHAFFTCNSSLQNYDLIQCIADRLLSALQNKQLLQYMISNYMKSLRHAGFDNETFYQKLGDVLSTQNTFSLNNNSSLSHALDTFRAFYAVGFAHQKFCTKLLTQVSRIISQKKAGLRFKDLVCLVWGSAALRLECPPVIVNELRRLIEERGTELCRLYPERYIEALVSLVLSATYPESALSHALSPHVLDSKHERKLEQNFQTLLLDEAVSVYCPNYRGHRLPKTYSSGLTGGSLCDVPKQRDQRKGLAVVEGRLRELLGHHGYVKCCGVLAFTQIPDLELCFTPGGEPVSVSDDDESIVISDSLISHQQVSITDRLTDSRGVYGLNRGTPENVHMKPVRQGNTNFRKVIVKVLGWNQFLLNKPVLTGLHHFELQLLQAKGYEIITVNPLLASQLEIMSTKEQVQVLNEKILSKIRPNHLKR